MTDPLAAWPVTQTWEQHLKNAGPTLGGVDHSMGVGTRLPVLSGVPEYVTPSTSPRPRWYNTGLGYAGAYRRPDGTRTIYGHLSGRAPDGAFLSGGAKGAPGSGVSSGPHCHTHDVLADGVTRARPGSTIASTGGAGGGGVTPIQEEEEIMEATPFIFHNSRPNMDDSAHPDFASTGWLTPRGFIRTSVGRGSRDAFSAARSYFEALGFRINPERACDINVLSWVLTNYPFPAAIDAASLTKAITDTLEGASVEVDPDVIAKAVDAALVDNFAGIPDAVLDAQAERLQS